MIATLLGNLERWLFEPPESIYGQPLWKLTRILRYPYALMRDILRGDLTLRAMSLVYTTLLSIVPLIALSFSVLKGLGYHRELEPVLYSFLEPLGDRGYELTAADHGLRRQRARRRARLARPDLPALHDAVDDPEGRGVASISCGASSSRAASCDASASTSA